MTADIELLPLPSVLLNWPHPTNHVAIRDYARAVAEHNVNRERERADRLAKEVEALKSDLGDYMDAANYQAARAERLAEALRLIATPQRSDGTWNRDRKACQQIAEDALRDHDQETKK